MKFLLFVYTLFLGIAIEVTRKIVVTHDYFSGEPMAKMPGFLLKELSSSGPFNKYFSHIELFIIFFVAFYIIDYYASPQALSSLKRYFCYFVFISIVGLMFVINSILVLIPTIEILDPDYSATILSTGIHYLFCLFVVIGVVFISKRFFFKKAAANQEKIME